jgi:hypothetical protein
MTLSRFEQAARSDNRRQEVNEVISGLRVIV